MPWKFKGRVCFQLSTREEVANSSCDPHGVFPMFLLSTVRNTYRLPFQNLCSYILHCGIYGKRVCWRGDFQKAIYYLGASKQRIKELHLAKKHEKQGSERRWDRVLMSFVCVSQVPSSQRKRKREGWNHRLWNQARARSRAARRWVQTLCLPSSLLTSDAHIALMFLGC